MGTTHSFEKRLANVGDLLTSISGGRLPASASAGHRAAMVALEASIEVRMYVTKEKQERSSRVCEVFLLFLQVG